jgi:large subunit ribosomal protein L21
MSYAIISVGGKQYRVREGERLLVDRVALDDGATFTPPVLLVGGNDAPSIAPDDVVVTAKVLGEAKGPKIRIGKYKKRTGYKRHTGFRASLTQIQIESIGGGKTRAASKKAAPAPAAVEETPAASAPVEAVAAPESAPLEAVAAPEVTAPTGLPDGYAALTVAAVKAEVGSWSREAAQAALAYEQEHGKRKGAIAALESALVEEGS